VKVQGEDPFDKKRKVKGKKEVEEPKAEKEHEPSL